MPYRQAIFLIQPSSLIYSFLAFRSRVTYILQKNSSSPLTFILYSSIRSYQSLTIVLNSLGRKARVMSSTQKKIITLSFIYRQSATLTHPSLVRVSFSSIYQSIRDSLNPYRAFLHLSSFPRSLYPSGGYRKISLGRAVLRNTFIASIQIVLYPKQAIRVATNLKSLVKSVAAYISRLVDYKSPLAYIRALNLNTSF